MSELKDNASLFNYYVSLIVNFSGEYNCKVAIPTKVVSKQTNWFKNTFGKLISFDSEEETQTLLIGDLDVIKEVNVEPIEWLDTRVKELKKRKEPKISYSKNPLTETDVNWKVWAEKYLNPLGKVSISKEPTSQDFLIGLINLNGTSKKGFYESLALLHTLATDEVEIFEQQLEENIDLIHAEVYETNKDLELHCVEAMAELIKTSSKKDTEGYNVLYSILTQYAEL